MFETCSKKTSSRTEERKKKKKEKSCLSLARKLITEVQSTHWKHNLIVSQRKDFKTMVVIWSSGKYPWYLKLSILEPQRAIIH